MSLLEDGSAILPILQTGSAGLAFLFGLMGLMIIKSHLANKSGDNTKILDIPPRMFNFMSIWLFATVLMFLVSCYIQFVAKPVKINVSVSPSMYMSDEKLKMYIRAGGKKIHLPLATSEAADEVNDIINLQLESNAQLDINIEDITKKYQNLKAVIGEKTAESARVVHADQGAEE